MSDPGVLRTGIPNELLLRIYRSSKGVLIYEEFRRLLESNSDLNSAYENQDLVYMGLWPENYFDFQRNLRLGHPLSFIQSRYPNQDLGITDKPAYLIKFLIENQVQIVFFVPPNLLGYGNRTYTEAEFNSLIEKSENLTSVIFVFDGYEEDGWRLKLKTK
jgi:hypothetical protein